MIEMRTTAPPLTLRVYGQLEIEATGPTPGERFVVVSITNTDRRRDLANLTRLGAAPVLRLDFGVDGRRGLTDEQAVRFWGFIEANLDGLDAVLLHCGAGALRSPALTLALGRAFHGDDRPLLADSGPDEATYRTAARAFPKVFGRPSPDDTADAHAAG